MIDDTENYSMRLVLYFDIDTEIAHYDNKRTYTFFSFISETSQGLYYSLNLVSPFSNLCILIGTFTTIQLKWKTGFNLLLLTLLQWNSDFQVCLILAVEFCAKFLKTLKYFLYFTSNID